MEAKASNGHEFYEAFQKLKEHLMSPFMMRKPSLWEICYLYLTVLEIVVSSVLVLERGQKYYPIYYASKVLLTLKPGILGWSN